MTCFLRKKAGLTPNGKKVLEIPLSELHPFKTHPFKVKDDGGHDGDRRQHPAVRRAGSRHRPPGPERLAMNWLPGTRPSPGQ